MTVTKYKSAKKLHALADSGVEHHYVGFNPTEGDDDCGVAIAYVGWGYRVGNAVIDLLVSVEIARTASAAGPLRSVSAGGTDRRYRTPPVHRGGVFFLRHLPFDGV